MYLLTAICVTSFNFKFLFYCSKAPIIHRYCITTYYYNITTTTVVLYCLATLCTLALHHSNLLISIFYVIKIVFFLLTIRCNFYFLYHNFFLRLLGQKILNLGIILLTITYSKLKHHYFLRTLINHNTYVIHK